MKLWYKGVFAQKEQRKPTLVVDFDGTIAEDLYPDIGEPQPGVKEALTRLSQAGYEIVIFTCRMSLNDGRPQGEAQKQKAMIAEWMAKNGIPFNRIDEGREGKPRADFFIDNKGLHYGGADNDWEKITAYILSKGKAS